MKKTIIVFLVIVVIVGAGAFFGGMKYAQSKAANGFQRGNFSGGMPTGGFGNASSTRGARAGAGFVSGEIISSDNSSVTIKLQNGGSKIVFYSDSTQISKTTDGNAADLKEGETIMASGTANQDGSLTAKTIQLRPVSQNQP